MRLLWSPEYLASWRTLPQTLTAGQATASIRRVGAVSGVAVLDTDLAAGLVLEASRDGFATTVSQTPLDAALTSVSPAIADASWRIRLPGSAGVPPASVGTLYPGTLADAQNPAFPFALEEAVIADDVVTNGGVGLSQIRYRAVTGTLGWKVIRDAEIITTWRPWHTATRGGRLGWVLEDPLTGALHLVRSPVSRFPFELVHPGLWSGSIAVEGLQ